MVDNKLKCGVCGEEALAVIASVFGPMSFAMCAECDRADRQPWAALVGGMMFIGRGREDEWVKPYMEATCAFYGKTEDELWEEVKKTEREYEEYEEKQRV